MLSPARLVRSPVALLLATGLLALTVIVTGTALLSRQAADDEAVLDARQSTEILAHSVAEPDLPRGLVDGSAAALDRFDRQVLRRLLVGDVRRVKIWDADGRIVYSDKTQLIGEVFGLDDDELEVLEGGGTDAEVSDLSKPENRYERGSGGLLEVYTRIESPEGVPLLFEAYWSADAVQGRQQEIAAAFRPIILGGLGLVLLVATTLLWLLTRRLRRGAVERERLLTAAVEASEAERGRIARDLHDGVVQDLAGATFTVSALARRDDVPAEARETLRGSARVLREGQRSLRSLMMEIYPPDLAPDSLAAALEDLLAPAQSRGIAVTLEVGAVERVPDQALRLVWRTAQEAVRNALRHSGASHLAVEVLTTAPAGSREPGQVVLRVTDDGSGFDPTVQRASRFGLRGLAGLAADAGGRLDVRSSTTGPGRGTTVTLELEVRP